MNYDSITLRYESPEIYEENDGKNLTIEIKGGNPKKNPKRQTYQNEILYAIFQKNNFKSKFPKQDWMCHNGGGVEQVVCESFTTGYLIFWLALCSKINDSGFKLMVRY